MEPLNEILKERLEKIKSFRDKGLEIYGSRFLPIESIAHLLNHFEEGKKARLAGRLMAVRSHGKSAFADLKDESARIQVYFKQDVVGEDAYQFFQKLDLGDIVGCEGTLFTSKTGEKSVRVDSFKLLSKIIQVLPEKWHGLKDVEIRYRRRFLDLIANDEVRKTFKTRSEIIRSIRKFLDSRGFMEVETPMMQPIPGGAKAEPFKTHHRALHLDLFLRVAPELYLKRLLVGGFEKVYEINRNFRNEGISVKHNPEFTMLELYQSYADMTDMMAITEEMISNLVKEIHGREVIPYGDKELDFKRPWRRISFYEALKEKTGVDWRNSKNLRKEAERLGVKLEANYDDVDILNEAFDEYVEPELTHPAFVVDYPLMMSPLAKRKAGTGDLVERFELYIAKMEIANAFSELNDPEDQRERFVRQKAALGEQKQIDEDFLLALEYAMPPAGGLGIGIDRLVMLLTNQHSIRDVILFPQLKPEEKEEIVG